MASTTIVSHILKDLPASWNCQMLANLDIKLDKLLPVLQNLDEQQRKNIATPVFGISLDQIKEVVASEIQKVSFTKAPKQQNFVPDFSNCKSG